MHAPLLGTGQLGHARLRARLDVVELLELRLQQARDGAVPGVGDHAVLGLVKVPRAEPVELVLEALDSPVR